jgi:MOSC domain-containing protein YiiM
LPVLHGFGLDPGDLKENIVVDFADLYELPSGSILRIGEAVVRVTFHCELCKKVLKRAQWSDLLHKRGVFGQFLNRGRISIGDRLVVMPSRAEIIPYDAKERIRWYLARQREPVMASRLIFEVGLPSSYARALPAILRKMPEVDRRAVIFKSHQTNR